MKTLDTSSLLPALLKNHNRDFSKHSSMLLRVIIRPNFTVILNWEQPSSKTNNWHFYRERISFPNITASGTFQPNKVTWDPSSSQMLESCGLRNSPNLSMSVFHGSRWNRSKFVNPSMVSPSSWRHPSSQDHMFLGSESKTSTRSLLKSANFSNLSKLSHSSESDVILRMKISTLTK